jgi:membrane associated rhomboid family serine protease
MVLQDRPKEKMNGKLSQNVNNHARSPYSYKKSSQIKPNISCLSYPVNEPQDNLDQQSLIQNSEDALQKPVSVVELKTITNENSNTCQNQTPVPQNKTNTVSVSKRKPRRPWFIWILSIIQIGVFIGELIKNWILTNTPFETNLSVNPLFGPSLYILINMGAGFSPCMHYINGITDIGNATIFPCPNSTTLQSNGCTLSDLCGFNGVSSKPNQWYRFIIPIFLHVGIIHIGLNLFTQLAIAGEIERKIGVLRIAFIYFTSGIFGFILGSNFAAEGLVRIGCSGSLFSIIALSVLNLFYNWKTIENPKIQLIIHLVDIIVNFVIGLLPGIDNFSHVGGFCMGLLLGLAILGSPINLRRRTKVKTISNITSRCYGLRWHRNFFSNRPKNWWTWWLVRFIAFAGAIVIFVLLTENFYSGRIKCTWCQYINCLPVNGWCDIGKLNFTNT